MKTLAIILSSLILAACGGGGVDDDELRPTPDIPACVAVSSNVQAAPVCERPRSVL